MPFLKSTLCLLLFSVAHFHLFSQNIEFSKDAFPSQKEALKKAKENIELGDGFYELGTIFLNQAIEPYLAANSFNPNNALLNFKLGRCYLNSNFKQKALPFLEQAKKLNKSIDPDIDFYLGQAYHLDKEWDKAVNHYIDFIKNKTTNTDPILIRKAEKSTAQVVICTLAMRGLVCACCVVSITPIK